MPCCWHTNVCILILLNRASQRAYLTISLEVFNKKLALTPTHIERGLGAMCESPFSVLVEAG